MFGQTKCSRCVCEIKCGGYIQRQVWKEDTRGSCLDRENVAGVWAGVWVSEDGQVEATFVAGNPELSSRSYTPPGHLLPPYLLCVCFFFPPLYYTPPCVPPP